MNRSRTSPNYPTAAVLIAAVAVSVAGRPASARQATPSSALSECTALVIYPESIRLRSSNDRARLVAVAAMPSGENADVTAEAEWTLESADVAQVHIGNAQSPPATTSQPSGQATTSQIEHSHYTLTPIRDGRTRLVAKWRGRMASADVVVEHAASAATVSFRHDVMPVLMKAGCNSGGCHGSAQGKNGFRLSLFGFEPEKDYQSLTRDLDARRVDLTDPHRSLLLRKPTGDVAHEGGQRLQPRGEHYEVLSRWIAARTPDDPPNLPALTGLTILPVEIVTRPDRIHRLVTMAAYSNGTARDVSTLAVYDSTDPLTARVSEDGVITAGLPGEAFIMARFGVFAVVTQIIVRAGAEFNWTGPATPPESAHPSGPQRVAARIDRAIDDKLRKLHVNPSELCDDETFVRRAYLDVIGLPPTVTEYRAFISDSAADKRAALINRLLERPEFPELWAMKWADLLRIESGSKRISFKAMHLYSAWLRGAILGNRPLDAMVRELLTASGGTFTNPAANFYLIEQDPALMAENVAQVFTGIRIQCAQCHNHPFERWTQDDYYGFAAFFAQIGKKPADDPREVIVTNSGSGGVKHPRGGADVPPKYLGGPVAMLSPGTDRRQALATWLTAPENPYFAAGLVDRVWAHFMGRGLVDPPDDVRVSNPPSHPQLRHELARGFIESGYDVRALVRAICGSRAYQTTGLTNPSNARDTRNYSHVTVRRIPAEILLDAISQACESPEKFTGLPLGARATQVADANAGSYFLGVFGRPPRQSVCTCERRNEPTLSQALHLINGDTLARKLAAPEGRLARLLKAQATTVAIVEELYIAALSRRPTADESAEAVKAIDADPPQRAAALEDLFWALLNSKEFVFRR